jgi:hypothetical protein
MTTEYTNFFRSNALQNLPKFGFFVSKQTIWQPWYDLTLSSERSLNYAQYYIFIQILAYNGILIAILTQNASYSRKK